MRAWRTATDKNETATLLRRLAVFFAHSEALMFGTDSNPNNFFAPHASLSLKLLLVVEYLLAHDLLPSDLDDLPPEEAAALFAQACRFAKRRLSGIEPTVLFSAYRPVRFSQN